MGLPDLTHLQFLILTALLDGEQSGRVVRKVLAEHGQEKSGPAFYQLMARLEDATFVKGRYEQKIIDGQIIKERFYTITRGGILAVDATKDFYAELARGKARGNLSHA
jgi:hypothetical protein